MSAWPSSPSARRRYCTAALALVLVTTACSRAPREEEAAEVTRRPDIVFVSLDTLRRDAVGIYDDQRSSSTPVLDRFASGAVVFERAWAPMPFTLASHMTIFTGLEPNAHGVAGDGVTLGETIPTLGSYLHEAGYSTHAVVSNKWMKGDFGFARGFDSYLELAREGRLRSAPEVNERARELLAAREETPLFLFLHYLDAHSDYGSPQGNTLPYYSPESPQAGARPADPAELASEFCPEASLCATQFLLAADRGEIAISSTAVERLRGQYARGVAALDADLGELIAILEAAGVFDEALIIVTADHGEEFAEHDRYLHTQPFVETTAVPLFIHFPAGRWRGRRVQTPVQHVDLLPSLLDFLGIDLRSPVQGESFLPHVRSEADAPDRRRAVRSQEKKTSRHVLRTSRWSLLYDPQSQTPQFFDLQTDPKERHDVASRHPRLVSAMLRELERRLDEDRRWRSRTVETGNGILSDHEIEELRALGYLQ